jgi:ADP-ribose pyrophosphatase YjhB (NUDIX family)
MQGPQKLIKVVAYITRSRHGKRQLLVFTHRDHPEAGLQVPAGTVKQDEGIEAALMREITEETGLTGLTIIRKLGTYTLHHPISNNLHERHVFHLAAPDDAPDAWQWTETCGGEIPDHEGYVFQLWWADLDGPIHLAGSQADYIHLIRDAVSGNTDE